MKDVVDNLLKGVGTGLSKGKLTISSVSFSGGKPDRDGDIHCKIEFEAKNASDVAINYVAIDAIIINTAGNILGSTEQKDCTNIMPGESERFNVWLYYNQKLACSDIENVRAIIACRAYYPMVRSLGTFALSSAPCVSQPIPVASMDKNLHILAGDLYHSEPDSDNESKVTLKILFQNISQEAYEKIDLTVTVNDKKNGELSEDSVSKSLSAGALSCFEVNSCYVSAKKLKGASVVVSVRIHKIGADGVAISEGMTLAEPESDAEENRVTVSGDFIYVKMAVVSDEVADDMISGKVDLLDYRYDIESNPSFVSLYGCEELALYFDEKALNSDDIGEVISGVKSTDVERKSFFADGDIDISERFGDSNVFISVERCIGEEYRQFSGTFDPQMLRVVRCRLTSPGFDVELYQVSYEEAEIIDETESEVDGFYLYRNGKTFAL